MQEQLDRIESKIDKYAEQTAKNSTDILWIKRIIGGLSSLATIISGYIFNRHA